jgi:hypothetical protein
MSVEQQMDRPQPYIPGVIAVCLKAAMNLAAEGDWDTLKTVAETIAQEARVRSLDARASEAGVVDSDAVGAVRELQEAGLLRPVLQPDGQIAFEITAHGRALLTQQ